MQHGSGYEGRHRGTLATVLLDGGSLGRLVVVGSETHFVLPFFQIPVLVLIHLYEISHRNILGHHLIDGSHEFPGIVQVKSGGEIAGIGTLGEHNEVTGLGSLAQRPDAIGPEIHGNLVGYVTAETVNANAVYPKTHSVDHGSAHLLVFIVQVGNVGPVGARRENDVPDRVMGVPVGVLFEPRVVPGGVVGHPVEDDAHTALVARLDQHAQVIHRAVLGSHSLVVTHRIGRVLAFLLANRVYGHNPKHIDAQVFDGVKASDNSLQGIGRSKHSRIDLIKHHVGHLRDIEGVRNGYSVVILGLATHGDDHHGHQENPNNLSHISKI